MTKIITLTRGKVTQVSDQDYDNLIKDDWYFDGKYAARKSPKGGHLRGLIRMHREIMQPPVGMEIDHINGDKLDNRRENLRVCSRSQNQQNKSILPNNTSGYIGVVWCKSKKKWRAESTHKNKHVHIGYFDNAQEAARAYDRKVIELFGPLARTNF